MLLGLKTVCKSRVILFCLDWSLKKDSQTIQYILDKFNIKLLINTGDSSCEARVLCHASKASSMQVITFTHGYITTCCGWTIDPIYSDKLIVWTENQQNYLKLMMPEFSKKISYLGHPKKYDIKFNKQNSILLVFGNFCFYKKSELDTSFKELANQLLKSQKHIILRLHPNQKINKELLGYIESFDGIELSNNSSIEKDFENSDIVFGASTSALIDAKFAGLNVYQLKNLSFMKSVEIDEIPFVKNSEVADIIAKNKRNSNVGNNNEFEVNFPSFIQELM